MSGDHRCLHVLTHSFPTRRSSDLRGGGEAGPAHGLHPLGQPCAQEGRARTGNRARRSSSGAHQPPSKPTLGAFGFLWLAPVQQGQRSEEHTSELQSLMRISYAVFCLKKKTHSIRTTPI